MTPSDLPGADPCTISAEWGIAPDLASRLIRGAEGFRAETLTIPQIISGSRTRRTQAELGTSGRPTAPDALSTHRTCPSTGADLRIGFAPTRVKKAILGRHMVMVGLRWGGGSKVDDGGIPKDWNHFDFGPRRDREAEAFRAAL